MILRDFITYWMDMAKSNHDVHDLSDVKRNNLIKFFCYYIAFNHIYDTVSEHGSERAKIKKVVRNNLKNFRNNGIDYNPFIDLSEESELLTTVRSNKVKENCFTSKNIIYNKISSSNILNLFSNIYQVRCNLFHGAKDMSTYRDEGLVKDSTKVLQHFLEEYLKL